MYKISTIKFYNAETKQWEVHNGEPSDLRFADVQREPTFSISPGKGCGTNHKYNPMTEARKRSIDAFNKPSIHHIPIHPKLVPIAELVLPYYTSNTMFIDTKPPFHVVQRSKLRHYLGKFKSLISSLFKKEVKINPSIVDNRSHTLLSIESNYSSAPTDKRRRK